ncbi:protein-L-isoaspartate O-methyltransferase [Acidisoma cellulosilytica]|uniref:Protein-L-isoaspartate O-methyltransferase n=1 Tax=Acidisoma cellulosilyticum TaxID=2802395 RepID=A0A963YZ92_9PROT|nr:protein-L-isoaspartate O-methyltransferase [Acidisoma cellulosilyticum]MCB8879656.1 protein-L-isoaspartate O-methyltransferase [Acidisoma cellulosilyticum]
MMASTAISFATARQFMVDSQLRPTKVTHPAVLDAMRRIPREQFLPGALAALAYGDQDIDLGSGRFLMAPLAFARLAQLLAPVDGERILVVGSGVGYGAAVLAACGARVTALDSDDALLANGRAVHQALGLTITSQAGDPLAGLPGVQAWDAILIEGMIPAIPAVFAGQLKPGQGRLVTVRASQAVPGATATGVAVIAERQGENLALTSAFDCTTAPLAGFAPVPEFQF